MKKAISPIIAAAMIALVIKVVVIIALVSKVIVAAMLCLCRKPKPYSRHTSQ